MSATWYGGFNVGDTNNTAFKPKPFEVGCKEGLRPLVYMFLPWCIIFEFINIANASYINVRNMRTLQQVKVLGDHELECLFDDGAKKIADIQPYLQSEAFKPLQDPAVFSRVVNMHYFVAWLNEEVDLSADTLWHIGVEVEESLTSVAAQD